MNKTWILCIVCVVVSAGLMAWGFRESSSVSGADTLRYAVLMTEDKGTDVMQFKQGAQTAAREFDAKLTFMTAAEEGEAASELLAFIDRACESAVDGIILSPCGQEVLDYAVERTDALRIPLVCLWDAPGEESVNVFTDYRRQGELLLESALAYGNVRDLPAAIFAGDTPEARLMLDGLTSGAFKDSPIYRCNKPEEIGMVLEGLSEGCLLFTLDASLTESTALEANGRFPLFGVDPGDSRVALLEQGLATGLIMRMPYAEGYLAVTAAAGTAGGEGPVYSPGRVVTREMMYESQNVKLMFPLLQ